ncbi:MAG: LPS assembly lipoprotein LptE [Simkaniaceae bacterium]
MSLFRKGVFFLLLFLLSSCGYRFVEIGEAQGKTITIPYVQGDEEGLLTAALANKIALLTPFSVVVSRGDYELEAKILSIEHEDIGFRYDREEKSRNFIEPKRLVSDEERKSLSIEVRLIERTTQKILLGPEVMTSYVNYDYVNSDTIDDLSFFSNGRRISVLQFSLGQLDAPENAREAAVTPLFDDLATQIAEGLNNFY